MPYHIMEYKDGYRVMSDNGTLLSRKPLSYKQALKQLRAVSISEGLFKPSRKRGGAKPSNPKLYDKIKKEIYSQYPKHSAYRSMMIVKEYKKAGGTYEDEAQNDMNTKKWLKQQWTDANHYYHTGEVVPCGSQNTKDLYGEYPLCRPLSILKRLSKEQLKEMIDKKNELGKRPLITSKLLGTEKFNIKPTISGSAIQKNKEFYNQLRSINYDPLQYLKDARKRARNAGYNPNDLFISDKNTHKLMILDDDDKYRYFGRVGYGDYLIWQHLEKMGEVPEGYADKKRNTFQKSHSKIRGNWMNDDFSPNMLALKINW